MNKVVCYALVLSSLGLLAGRMLAPHLAHPAEPNRPNPVRPRQPGKMLPANATRPIAVPLVSSPSRKVASASAPLQAQIDLPIPEGGRGEATIYWETRGTPTRHPARQASRTQFTGLPTATLDLPIPETGSAETTIYWEEPAPGQPTIPASRASAKRLASKPVKNRTTKLAVPAPSVTGLPMSHEPIIDFPALEVPAEDVPMTNVPLVVSPHFLPMNAPASTPDDVPSVAPLVVSELAISDSFALRFGMPAAFDRPRLEPDAPATDDQSHLPNFAQPEDAPRFVASDITAKFGLPGSHKQDDDSEDAKPTAESPEGDAFVPVSSQPIMPRFGSVSGAAISPTANLPSETRVPQQETRPTAPVAAPSPATALRLGVPSSLVNLLNQANPANVVNVPTQDQRPTLLTQPTQPTAIAPAGYVESVPLVPSRDLPRIINEEP